jgi:hypothetical protein
VPGNGPYYERLGFRYLAPDEETPGLRAIRARERAMGLDAWPRACTTRGVGERRASRYIALASVGASVSWRSMPATSVWHQ